MSLLIFAKRLMLFIREYERMNFEFQYHEFDRVDRIEAGQQPGYSVIKQFFLSCGGNDSVNRDIELHNIESANKKQKSFNHAEMAMTLLRKFRQQRCRLKIFDPLPVDISSLFVRACIKSSDPEIGTRL